MKKTKTKAVLRETKTDVFQGQSPKHLALCFLNVPCLCCVFVGMLFHQLVLAFLHANGEQHMEILMLISVFFFVCFVFKKHKKQTPSRVRHPSECTF